MKKAAEIFGKVVSVVATVCIVAAAVVVGGPRVLGWKPMTVLSGSMEPTYPVGSVVYVRPADPKEVAVGDPITFYLEDGKTVVTHRVVKIDAQKQSFSTKGDANNVEDGGAVPYSSLIGKPVLSVPRLGFLMSYIGTAQGMILAISLLAGLLLLAFLPEFWTKKGEKSSAAAQSKGG